MKTYRFVTAAHYDVFAETLEEAVKEFNEIKRKKDPPTVDMVSRIEVKDSQGEYIPVDHPLRAEYLPASEPA